MADGIVKQSSYGSSAEGTTPGYRQNRRAELVTPSLYEQLALDGRVYVSSDADENDVVTGATSYAATTPTFLLEVSDGVAVIPLHISLAQAGTVAGALIHVAMSIDNIARYASGGTSEQVRNVRTDRPNSASTKVYSGATAAAAGSAVALKHITLDPDVTDPQVGEHVSWVAGRDFFAPVLIGPAALLIFTYAGTTGPSWEWAITFAEMAESDLI